VKEVVAAVDVSGPAARVQAGIREHLGVGAMSTWR
jgi:DNA-binding IclR family transcriptional regulator